MAKIAAFDVDCQKTFTPICPNELPVPKGHHIVDALNGQARLCDYRLGSKDAHHPEAVWSTAHSDAVLPEHVDQLWPQHAIVGTEGFELLEGLPKPIDYDFFVWKGVELDLHPYGSCYHDLAEQRSTGVIEFLRDQQVDTIVVGGLALEYCVAKTALQLVQAGFRVIVHLDATRALDVVDGERALKQMQQKQITICSDLKSLEQQLGL